MNHSLEERKPLALPGRAWMLVLTLVVAGVIVLTRLPWALAIFQGFYSNYDEIILTRTSLLTLTGVPADALCWPAGPQRLLYTPLLLADWLIHRPPGPIVTSLVDHLSLRMREMWYAIWLMRCLVMVVFSLGVASLFIPLAKSTRSVWMALMWIAVMASLPVLWHRSYQGLADAFAAGLLCMALAVVWRDKPTLWRPAIAGVLMGLALSSKITFLAAVPFVSAMCMHLSPRPWRALLAYGLAMIPAGLLGAPWLLTDPIRFCKSLLGNVVRGELPADAPPLWIRYPQNFLDGMPPWIILLLIIGLILAWRRGARILAVGALLGLAFVVATTIRANIVAPNYMIPLAMVTVALAAATLGPPLVTWLRESSRPWLGGGVLALLLASLLAWNTFQAIKCERNVRLHYDDLFNVVKVIRSHPEIHRVGVGMWTFDTLLPHISSESLTRFVRQFEEQVGEDKSTIPFMQKQLKWSDYDARMFVRSFNERERNTFMSYRLAAGRDNSFPGLDVLVGGEVLRFGGFTTEQMFEELQAGRLDLLVVNVAPDNPPGGFRAGRSPDVGYMVYLRPGLAWPQSSNPSGTPDYRR